MRKRTKAGDDVIYSNKSWPIYCKLWPAKKTAIVVIHITLSAPLLWKGEGKMEGGGDEWEGQTFTVAL